MFERCDQIIAVPQRFQFVSQDARIIGVGPDELPETVGAGLRSGVFGCVGVSHGGLTSDDCLVVHGINKVVVQIHCLELRYWTSIVDEWTSQSGCAKYPPYGISGRRHAAAPVVYYFSCECLLAMAVVFASRCC